MMLSIILTVYNKGPYLYRALDAILNQDTTMSDEYEVLAVNDGSTDGSASILEEYEQKDSRVRVITQSNQGLSMARNNGVEPSKGEYIWFVDADDVVSNNAVHSICNAAISNPDVIPIYARTEGINKIRNKIDPKSPNGKDILSKGGWEHCGVFWVFKKDFLMRTGLRFYPGIYHEDAEFTPRMLYMAETVRVVPEVLYTVFHGDDNSITQVPRPKRAYDMLTVVERLMEFFIKHDEYKTTIWNIMCNNNAGILNTAFYVILCNNKTECDKYNKYVYEKRHIFRSFTGASLLKYRLEGCLFRLFPRHSVDVFKLVHNLMK